ncbi:MAG: hypothetical protein IKZ49_00825 [Alphaproteobacteria bacterium]|nr:hypothetical protein [Alphaproteobacteria bacterium]
MTQKLFLTSALAMGVIAPAFAEPSNTGTFPSDGYMQEDYTYTNAATADNMDSVYEGNVNAVAEYENILYQIGAGQYLPAGGESVISCDQPGSFCPGVSGDVTYNANAAQGLTSCSTATNGDFTSSDGTGSSAESCYRACNISNMGSNGTISTIAHATALSGNDYYGNGADTCEPTACDPGWHVKPAVNNPDLVSLLGLDRVEDRGYVSNNGENYASVAMFNLSTTNDKGKFIIEYPGKGRLTGHGICSTHVGTRTRDQTTNTYTNVTMINSMLSDETGQEGAIYCYCKIDGYIPNGENELIISANPWIFVEDTTYSGGVVGCSSNCVAYCTNVFTESDANYLSYRNIILGSVAPTLASCEANTITINWTDASSADISANNAGTATYGEDVRTPVKATTKPGQRFKGWRFVAPTPVSVEPEEP